MLPKEAGLLCEVLTLLLRAVFALQYRRARRQGILSAPSGTMPCIQFFGSALQVTPHVHEMVPDGVSMPQEGGVRFETLPPPTQGAVGSLWCSTMARPIPSPV